MSIEQSDLPVIHIVGGNISEAWHNVVLAVYDCGVRVATPKHQEGVTPPGWDATVAIEVISPLSQPRFHKIGIPGFIQELEVYRLEAVWGIHNNWVGHGWDYTYHERIFQYKVGNQTIDQIANMIKVIKTNYEEKGRVSGRDFQVTTWMPWSDPFVDDPPCLQRIHFRLLKNENEDGYILHMTTHWRSRDLFKAWLMNVYAMTDLQRLVAKWIEAALGFKVTVGKYMDFSNSLHLYGAYTDDIEGAIGRMRDKDYRDFSWDLTDLKWDLEATLTKTRHLTAAQNDAEAKGYGKMQPENILTEIGYDVPNFPYPTKWDE